MALPNQLPQPHTPSVLNFGLAPWQTASLFTPAPALDLTNSTGLTAYLASTKFAAANVETLTGGCLGFTYRVTLKNPAPYRTVVVKHSLDYACSDGMPVSSERMTFEYEALTAIARSGLVTSDSRVQVPRVLFYDPYTYTLIMEDLAPARSLSSFLLEAFKAGTIDSVSGQIGGALGDFMGRFHQWSAQPEQARLRIQFQENTVSKETIPRVWYRRMMTTAKDYDVKKPWMDKFIEQRMQVARNGGNVIIMGDFWVENILVSTEPDLRLYIIDWEMARCANPEVDIGCFAAAVHSIAYVNSSLSSNFRLMQHFMRKYKESFLVDEVEVAFAAGLYVMSFGTIMSWDALWDEENRKEIVGYGLNLLEAGMRGNVEEIRKNAVVRNMY